MSTPAKPKSGLSVFKLSPKARASLARLKKIYGTNKNAVERALFALENANQNTK